jgi:hypothetical protein
VWIITAWQCISQDVIVKGFKKCCISAAVDENNGYMLWNGGEEAGNIGSECEEYESTDCENGDSGTDW